MRIATTGALALVAVLTATGTGAENRLTNPDFSSALMTNGWMNGAPASIQLAWESQDRSDDPDSGSLRMTNTFETGSMFGGNGAFQCVPAHPGDSFAFGNWIFVPAAQATTGDAPPPGRTAHPSGAYGTKVCSSALRPEKRVTWERTRQKRWTARGS